MKKYRVIRNYVSEHYTIIEAENEDIAIEKAQNLTDGSWSPTINDGYGYPFEAEIIKE